MYVLAWLFTKLNPLIKVLRLRIIILIIVILPQMMWAQTRVPDIKARDLNGDIFALKTLTQDNKPLISLYLARVLSVNMSHISDLTIIFHQLLMLSTAA